MKKIIALLLAAVMVIGLVACGSSSTTTTTAAPATTAAASSNDTTTAAATEAATTGEYPVIRFAYTRMFTTEDEPLVEEAMNEILRETCGCEIDLVAIDFSNMQTQFNLLLSGGSDSIDIFSSFWYMPLTTLVANGQLADLTELIKEYPEVTAIWDEYPEVLECCKVNGKLYALPTYGAYSSPNLVLAKKTDSDNANIDWSTVHTLEDVTRVMIEMKQANPDHYYVPAAQEPYYIPKDIDTLGSNIFTGVLTDPTNSTTVENYWESDYFLNFMEQVRIWVDNDLMYPDSMSNTYPTLMSLQYGLTYATPGYGFDAEESCYEANIQMQYGDELVGANISDRLVTTSNITTYLWHVTSFSQNKELAMKVLAAFYTDCRLDDLLGNGVEGYNYQVLDNGTLAFCEGEDMTNCGWTGIGASYSLPNVKDCPSWYYQPEGYFESLWESNKECQFSLAMGFVFDSTSVADEITACTNVYNQYYLALINGELDIDQGIATIQKGMKDAGIDTIIAEMQRQLDAYLASK